MSNTNRKNKTEDRNGKKKVTMFKRQVQRTNVKADLSAMVKRQG